jgi:hypothetical protein
MKVPYPAETSPQHNFRKAAHDGGDLEESSGPILCVKMCIGVRKL